MPRLRAFWSRFVLLTLVLRAGSASAQGVDSTKATGTDSTTRPKRIAPPVQGPPISAGRAFFYSFAIPGLGQAKLDRPMPAAVFFLLEVTSLAMANRTASDVRGARTFQSDSMPLTYRTDATTGAVVLGSNGAPEVATWKVSNYPAELVKARRLQYEDWMAIIIFNHLFSGADAFVAAQLWDLPQRVQLRAFPMPRGGAGVAMTIPFR